MNARDRIRAAGRGTSRRRAHRQQRRRAPLRRGQPDQGDDPHGDGDMVNGRGDDPNMHDILTGSNMDGTALHRRGLRQLRQLDQQQRRGERRGRPPRPDAGRPEPDLVELGHPSRGCGPGEPAADGRQRVLLLASRPAGEGEGAAGAGALVAGGGRVGGCGSGARGVWSRRGEQAGRTRQHRLHRGDDVDRGPRRDRRRRHHGDHSHRRHRAERPPHGDGQAPLHHRGGQRPDRA